MPTYELTFPLNLSRKVTVTADDEEDAIEKGLEELNGTTITETLTFDDIDEDNVEIDVTDDETEE